MGDFDRRNVSIDSEIFDWYIFSMEVSEEGDLLFYCMWVDVDKVYVDIVISWNGFFDFGYSFSYFFGVEVIIIS